MIAASDLIFQVRLGEREVHDLKRDFGHTSKPFGEFLKSFVDSLNSLARVEISGASKECLGRAKVVVSYRIDSAHTLSVPISAPRVDRSTYYHLIMEIISEEQQVVKETALPDSQKMTAPQKPDTSVWRDQLYCFNRIRVTCGGTHQSPADILRKKCLIPRAR